MPATRLSDLRIKSAKPAPGRPQVDIWDSSVRGLSLRVSSKGIKTFSFKYRNGTGRERRLTIGRYPDLTLGDARTLALQFRAQIAKGEDPAAKKQVATDTLDALVSEFLIRHASKNRTAPETARLFKREVLPTLGKCNYAEISKRDVIALIDKIVDRGTPTLARSVFAALRKMFGWAVSRDLLALSPCYGLAAPASPAPRDRVLSKSEVVAIWRAITSMGGPFADIVKLLLLTGQRRQQIAALRWSWIDFETLTISFPASVMKNKRDFILPLNRPAFDILAQLPRFSSEDRIFPARRYKSEGSFSGFSKAKLRLDKLAKVTDWRLHDLRRVVSTGMNEIGTDSGTVERVLSHAIGGVAGVYNRHGYLPEKRAALDRWGKHIIAIVSA